MELLTRIQQICGKQNHILNVLHIEDPFLKISGNCSMQILYKIELISFRLSEQCWKCCHVSSNYAEVPVCMDRYAEVPVCMDRWKGLSGWLVVSDYTCCWNCHFCFRLQFETADDQDFIAIQNAIEEVISELQKLPGLSYLEEVRVQYYNFGGRVWMMSCERKPARSC